MGIRQKFSHLRRTSTGWRDESGQSIILFALMLIPLLLMLALAVDLGVAYAEKRQSQSVADSGAMAATEVIGQRIKTGNFSGMSAEICAAVNAVAANTSGASRGYKVGNCDPIGGGSSIIDAVFTDINGNEISGATIDPNVDVPSARGVRLTPSRVVATHFYRIIDPNPVNVGSTATAVIGVVTNLNESYPGFVPFIAWQSADGCSGGDVDNDGVTDPTNGKGCMVPGATVTFHTTQWTKCHDGGGSKECGLNEEYYDALNDPPPQWAVNDTSFKGLIRSESGFYNLGGEILIDAKGGNTAGDPAYDRLRAIWDAAQPGPAYVYLPVIDWAKENGSTNDGKFTLHITGYAKVQLQVNPNGGGGETYWGTVVDPGVIDWGQIGDGTSTGTTTILGRRFLR